MRRLTVSVLMPGLGAMSSSNSIASCCKKRNHADTIPTCGDVNKQPQLFCHTWSNRDSLPHCWDKESSWTPRPACTYPPVDHSQTPLCRSQFWSSWLVVVLELLLPLSSGASGTKKINQRWKHIWSVAAVSCDCLPMAKWNFQSTCVQLLSRLLLQTHPRDKDDNAKVSLRYNPLPLSLNPSY